MAKTSTIVDLTTGLSGSEKAAAGATGQILLIKTETGMNDIHDVYDTVAAAQAISNNWDTE